MKFTVASSELQKALTKVNGVVPSKSTLPILENILFVLNKNTLKLVATDLEVSMSANLEVKGAEDGSIAVPAKRILDTVRALPDVQLIFHADATSNKIKMVTESGEYNLVGESSEEFPAGPQFKAENEVVLSGSTLGGIISQTIFSVSTDELRPAMTGVLFQFQGNALTVVSTVCSAAHLCIARPMIFRASLSAFSFASSSVFLIITAASCFTSSSSLFNRICLASSLVIPATL